jgi:hypothetical protein
VPLISGRLISKIAGLKARAQILGLLHDLSLQFQLRNLLVADTCERLQNRFVVIDDEDMLCYRAGVTKT